MGLPKLIMKDGELEIARVEQSKEENEMEKTRTARNVLENVENRIGEIEAYKERHGRAKRFRTYDVCVELSIFDWWTDMLSLSQLKQMEDFLLKAILRGYDKYVCFKVGAKGCASGMWAYKALSDNGFAPDGECIYRSFYSDHNYWDVFLPNGKWLQEVAKSKGDDRCRFTLKEVDEAITEVKA